MDGVLIYMLIASARWSASHKGKLPLFHADSALLKSYVLPLERQLFHSINRIRRIHGLDTLAWDWNLYYMSMIHSMEMAEEDYMSHKGFPGRAMQSGFPVCVENVGNVYGIVLNGGRVEIQTAGMVIRQHPHYLMDVIRWWMANEGHRRNILQPDIRKGSIAVYPGRNRIFITFFACGSPSDSQ